MAYCVDLELSLHRYPEANRYWVVGRFCPPGSDAPCGEEAVTQIDVDQLDLLVRKLAYDAYGQRLTWCLFGPAPIRGLLDRARQVAVTHDPPLPLRLRLQIGADAAELHGLHWELLRDPDYPTGLRIDLERDGKLVADPKQPGRRLATDENTLFSRYLLSSDPRPVRLQPRSHPTALVVVANPLDAGTYRDERGDHLPPIDVPGEVTRARQALTGFAVTILCSDSSLNADGPPTLCNLLACLHEEYDLLYLVAHGTLLEDGQPRLYLEDPDRCAHPVSADDTIQPPGESVPGLLSQLRQLRFLPRLVVLASCHSASSVKPGEVPGVDEDDRDQEQVLPHRRALSALGPRLVEIGIPAVVAMQAAVTMSTIETCMPVFFTELRRDGLIDRAMSAARQAVQDRWDWWVPVLYTRLDSGLIFGPGGRALASYREKVLRGTEFLELPGDGRGDLSLQVPLERLYIRLRAIPVEGPQSDGAGERGEQEESAAKPSVSKQSGNGQVEVLDQLLRQLTSYDSRAEPRAASGNELQVRFGPDSEPSDAQARQDGARTGDAGSQPEPVDPEALLEQHERLVIVGAAGSGKSTLLHWLARRAAREPDKPLPVLVSLRDYAAYRGAGGQDSLQTFALDRAAGDDEPCLQALKEAAKGGRIRWLVDALDESLGWRKKAVREITRLAGTVVLTSRRTAYELSDLVAWPCYEILDLSPEDREGFVRQWFDLLAERQDRGADWVASRVAGLLQYLVQQPRLASITVNPLMLTFLVVLASSEPAPDLPAQRTGLYESYLETLVDREVARRPVEGAEGRPAFVLGPLKAPLARQAALDGFFLLGSRLHWIYYGGKEADLPERERMVDYVADRLDPEKDQYDLGQREVVDLADAVVDFWREAGMVELLGLPGRQETYLGFRYLTFQEYAASRRLADLWTRDPGAVQRLLRPRLHHHGWREVVLLLAEQLAGRDAAAGVLAGQVLSAHSPYEEALCRDLRLAAEIVDEAPGDAPVMVQRMARRLAWLVAPRLVQVQRGLLWALWALGLLFFGLVLPWWGALLTCVGWSALWLAAFGGYSPRLRALLWLPSRLPGLRVPRAERVSILAHLGGAAVDPLLRAMEDEDYEIRKAAGEALSRVGAPAVEPLLRLAAGKDWQFNMAVGQSLREITDDRAVEPLIEALASKDISLQRSAEEALARIGGPAVPALIRALGGEESRVSKSAERTLRNIGEAGTEPFLRATVSDDPEERRVAALALGDYGTKVAVAPLCRALSDSERWVCRAAARALGRLGERLGTESVRPAMEPLRGALGHGELGVRQAVAEALGRIGDKEFALPLLLRALEDGEPEVRKAAAEAMGRLRARGAVDALCAALADSDYRVGGAAGEALGRIGDPRALEPLFQAMTSDWPEVGPSAVLALGRIGDTRAVKPLVELLQDPGWFKKDSAIQALRLIGERHGPEVLAEGMPLLRQALADEWPYTRRAAVEALVRLGDRSVLDRVVAMLDDEASSVRQAAAEALGYLGDAESAVVPLLQHLEENEWTVGRAAARSLGKIGDKRAVEPLLRVATDILSPVRLEAWQALESLGPVAVETLIEMLQHAADDMRTAAANALGYLGGDRALEPLVQLLSRDHGSPGRAAGFALQQIGQPAVEPLLSALSGEKWEWKPHLRVVSLLEGIGQPAVDPLLDALEQGQGQVCLVAIEVLGRIGDGRAVAPLCTILGSDESGDSEMRYQAALALGKIGDLRALDSLLRTLKDDGPNVRWASAEALGALGDRRSMDGLLQAVDDSSGEVREAAALALGRCGDERAVTPLVHRLRDRDPDVRAAAATALGRLADKISSIAVLRRVARGLWWRLTDTGDIPEAAYGALGLVVARLTELEVAGLAWEDTGSGHRRATRLLRRGGTDRVRTVPD